MPNISNTILGSQAARIGGINSPCPKESATALKI